MLHFLLKGTPQA